MVRKIHLILLLGVLFLYSCGDEPVYDVAPVFEPYVERFVEEALTYGISYDFQEEGLEIVFRDAVSKESGGQCNSSGLIEIERFFWNDLDDFEKEGLIFHELGHCVLGRGHKNALLPNGEWGSRMRGSPLPDGTNAVINYTGTRLPFYRDEMFDPDTPIPDWASWTRSFDEFDESDKALVFQFSDTTEFEESPIGLANSNFEIDLVYNTGTSEGFVGVQFFGESNDDRIRVGFNREGLFAIDSGKRVWGLMYLKNNFDQLISGDNRITIRRIGDFYWVFLNEEFVYWFDYKVPVRTTVASLNAGVLGSPSYTSVRVSSLP